MVTAMPKRNTIKSHGYIPITPMRDLAKEPGENKRYKRQTPHDLTTNELLKKLCAKGPDGCNETCGNWGVCEYGKAITERAKGMRVAAKIMLGRRGSVIKYFKDWNELCDWVRDHHDHMTALNAELIKASDIRQGKEKDNGSE